MKMKIKLYEEYRPDDGEGFGEESFGEEVSRAFGQKKEIAKKRPVLQKNHREILNALYNFYLSDENDPLQKGDMVIYNNPKSEHDGQEFEFIEVRDEDGKYRLKRGKNVLYASPARVTKETTKANEDRMTKLKQVLEAMIASGKLLKRDVDEFLKKKSVDPFDEENWDEK